MKIDKNLNLVLRLSDEKGDFIVHSVPLPTLLYAANWRVFRSAYEDIIADGMGSAVALAKTILEDAAEKHDRVKEVNELLDTLAGATMVIRGTPVLLNHSDLDEDIKEEVLSRLVFFMSCYRHILPTQMKDWLPAISSVLNLELTPLSVQQLTSYPSTAPEISKTTSTTNESIMPTATSVPI